MVAVEAHATVLGNLLKHGSHNHYLVTNGVPAGFGLVGAELTPGKVNHWTLFFADVAEEDTKKARRAAKRITPEFRQLVRQTVRPPQEHPIRGRLYG